MAARRVLLVEPVHFFSNPQTAADNFFQAKPHAVSDQVIRLAQAEFKGLVEILSSAGIETVVFKPEDDLITPDALYPNNWFSTLKGGTLILYPMMAENRRLERRPEIIEWLRNHYPKEIDLTYDENRGIFLEGTGSLVIDHRNKTGYASLSQRTSSNLLFEWSRNTGYEIVLFTSYDSRGETIYHTNVVMTIADDFAIVCMDAIDDEDAKDRVFNSLVKTGHEIINISLSQVNNFCGNCLELENKKGDKFLLMSDNALRHFTEGQRSTISRYCRILSAPLETIEKYGGGGARCMVAELF